MSEKLIDLGNGLELWRVPLDEMREQDENARSMSKPMFERLTRTIGKDKRLEALPLCALVEGHLEIVSGHHRVRAARSAGLPDVYAIVDVTGLSRDQIRAKQLAHNAIAGEDNPELLARIYAKIEDANARLESFVDPAAVGAQIASKLKFSPVEFQLEHRLIIVAFMPTELDSFDTALKAIEKYINRETEEIWIASVGGFEKFKRAMQATEKAANVRSVGTVLDKMAEIVMEKLGENEQDEEPAS